MDSSERKIYVSRENEEEYRLFSARTARGYLKTGLIQENDMAWCEGMNSWAPLIRVLESLEAKTPATTTQSAATATEPPKPPTKIPAAKVAEICFQLALSFQDSYTKVIRDLQTTATKEEEIDYGQVWVELVYLGCVVVDHAIEASLDEDTREFVLKLYRSHLYRVKIEGIHSFRPIKTRLLVYGQEAHNMRSKMSDEAVGQKFAHFCGGKNSKKLISIGSTLFHTIYDHVSAKLGEMDIEKRAR
jgi:hypothetical protein